MICQHRSCNCDTIHGRVQTQLSRSLRQNRSTSRYAIVKVHLCPVFDNWRVRSRSSHEHMQKGHSGDKEHLYITSSPSAAAEATSNRRIDLGRRRIPEGDGLQLPYSLERR